MIMFRFHARYFSFLIFVNHRRCSFSLFTLISMAPNSGQLNHLIISILFFFVHLHFSPLHTFDIYEWNAIFFCILEWTPEKTRVREAKQWKQWTCLPSVPIGLKCCRELRRESNRGIKNFSLFHPLTVSVSVLPRPRYKLNDNTNENICFIAL